ncbi:uncharacterized protein E0L32_010423 [Thyridium curvatum]|uniref:Large ribosomal subunit protein uL3m n=1 Tax=Thyridium curvatum TaxID=1093900 RepID=A0A507ASI9_9PEZI|nr:uncharacterized protein E0L32_010423 [Thyridium curvatum]TPX07848.1 hypothetical protein E0L32_010423 [Thyridium curvatum]
MAPRLPARCWATTRLLLAAEAQPHPTTLPFLSRTTARGVKYGWSTQPRRAAKPTRFNQATAGLPAPSASPAAALRRKEKTTPLRTGLLATKKGMTAFYTRRGTRIPCTVLQLDGVQVVAARTRASNGYWAVQVGCGERRAVTATAPLLGYFEAKGIAPKQHLAEFRVRGKEGLLPVGAELRPDWFHVGQWVDVRSNSRGMGFAGGMKKHGFKGQEASHGNSKNHRTIGTTGPSQGSGSRVMPGKKMPGRMGNERVTVQNLSVLMVDNELGIVVVKGAVAGPKGALVKIQDAVKKPDPSKDFVEKSLQLVNERNPDAAELLEAARAKHLELKAMRKEGRIAELLKDGMSARTTMGAVAAAEMLDTTAKPEETATL